MRLFGLDIQRTRKSGSQLSTPSKWVTIFESFAGAWQRNVTEGAATVLTYPTLYACIARIAGDISKLPFKLVRHEGGIWTTVQNPAYSPVLRKPNDYQTGAQFREHWVVTKLEQGNAYALKARDARGVVSSLYVLDPHRVSPLVSESGRVFYRLYTDALNNIPSDYPAENLIVPASEIIHDRCLTLHHPLIGVPPVAAANWAAVKNLKILRSSTEFFANNAQVGGVLTAPAGISDAAANRLQKYWEENYTQGNAGRVAVIGADMKFQPFAMKSIDAQMVEQMRYSDEQICQPFGIPPFKVGIGTIPAGLSVDGINQLYYSDALQVHIEHMEWLLDDGLSIRHPEGVELDLEPLIRMDEGKQAEVESKLVGGKIKMPNEGRRRFNLPATAGGDTLWGQHQDYPLGVLAQRTDLTEVAPADASQDDADARRALAVLEAAAEARKAIGGLHAV